ncbi:MAG: hypothetical protein JWO03_3656 [Bacteroidetes bacterium]|nr:hypothetical protein [Bacteroidota bacterium]
MKRITELTEERWRTVHIRDEYGNRYSDTEEYLAKRPVKTVTSGPRFGHHIVDLICFQIIIYTVNWGIGLLYTAFQFNPFINLTIALFGSVFLLLLYPALYMFCEYQWQRTPGKFLTDTFVIDEYGNKPPLRAIIFRSLIRLVPFEPFSCWGDTYSYGWHDRWAKTWVVTREELTELKRLQMEQNEVDPA